MNNKDAIITKKYKSLVQFITYGVIGVFSALSDSLFFYSFKNVLNIYLLNIISVNIGITISFFLNTFINFKKKDRLLLRATSFYLIGYSGLLFSSLFLLIGIDLLNQDIMLVKILSIFIIACYQYILNKYISFRQLK